MSLSARTLWRESPLGAPLRNYVVKVRALMKVEAALAHSAAADAVAAADAIAAADAAGENVAAEVEA